VAGEELARREFGDYVSVHNFRDAIEDGTAVWARTSKDERAFFMRMSNSTRPLPEVELPAYLVDRWPEQAG